MHSRTDVNDTIESSPTAVLAEYAAGLSIATVPPAVVARARTVLVDTIGVLLAASAAGSVRTAVALLPHTKDGPCTVVGHGRIASAETAALVNGIGGHDIELDDSHGPSRTHAAAVIVPAALAATEISAAPTWGELLVAITAAYDVQARVSKAIGPQTQFDRGFHPSAVCGAIGAAVAAGRMLRLSVEHLRSAIGLAASQSSGLLAFGEVDSHMAKSFQTGVAARNGVTAALFARGGYRGTLDVLTGRHNLLTPFGGASADPGELVRELGIHYEISDTTIKRHPCGAPIHAAIDALLALMESHAIDVDSIEQMDVALAHDAVPRVDHSGLWTQNIQYVLALAADQGRVRLEHFEPEWTSNPRIQALANRVRLSGSNDLQAIFPDHKGAVVTLRTARGDATATLNEPLWNSMAGVGEAELHEKFVGVAARALSGDAVDELWKLLASLDAAGDIGTRLFDILAGERTGA